MGPRTENRTRIAPPPGRAVQLLERAAAGLDAAAGAPGARERYLHAHLAALRTAAALVEVAGLPTSGRRPGVRSVWDILARCRPDLEAWATYFADGADLRAALETGRTETVPVERSRQLAEHAEAFWALARHELGMDTQAELRLGAGRLAS